MSEGNSTPSIGIEEYGRLTQESLAKLIVPFREDGWGTGRCLFSNSWEDERTSVGKTIDSAYVPDVFEIDDQIESDPVERDANTVSLEEAEQEMEVYDAD